MSNFFKASSLALFLALLSPLAAAAQTQVCGTFTLELNDTYGDGWNGNELDLSFTGGDSTYTFSSGYQATYSLTVPYLDTVEFIWQAGGSYTSECSFRILDASGTAVFSSSQGNNMSAGSTQFTAYCATAPVPQVCGTIYLELYDSYGDGWNGNELDVAFTGGDSTYTFSSGSQASFTLNIPYQDTAHFIWQNGGSYTSECTFSIKDASGTVLYTSPTGNNMTIGAYQYSVQCNSLATCIAPSGVSVSTGTNSASVTWTTNAPLYSYNLVEYGPVGFVQGTGAIDTVWASGDSAYFDGLNPATQYDFKVTTICSASDSSQTMGVSGVYTQCAAIATPWSENFDATTTGSAFNPSLPQCWDFYTNSTFSYYYPYVYNRNYSFYANSGSNFLYAYRSSSSSTSGAYADTTMAIMPEIQGLDSATKQLKFYARTTSAGRPGEVIIGLTDAAGTPSSLKIVDTVYAPATTYSEYTVYLDAATAGDARIAFVFMRTIGTYDYVCIDDVEVSDIPACPEPISLSLISASRSTATIGWTSSLSAYDIEIGPEGFGLGTGTSYTSTSNSVTVNGLSANSYYDAYVRSNCTSAGDGYSAWAGPFTFKTECGYFNAPFEEDFGYSDGTGSSSNPDLPDCWEHQNLSSYQYNYAYVDKYWYYGNQATDSAYVYLRSYYSQYNSSTAIGDTNALILPLITGLNAGYDQLSINARAASTSAAYSSDIVVGTTDTLGDLSTLTIIDTISVQGTSYTDYDLDLSSISSSDRRLVLFTYSKSNPGYTYGYNATYIDKISLSRLPVCADPYDFSYYASTSEAFISWKDSTYADTYSIEYGPSGFTQGTGNTIVTGISNTDYSISGLTANQTYDVYIKSNCSSVSLTSGWAGPFSVMASCTSYPLPYANGFENKPTTYGSSSNPNLPDCWVYSKNTNPGNSYSYGTTSTWSSYSGSGYLYNRQSNIVGDTVVVSLPRIDNLSTEGAVLKFWAKVSSTFYPGHMSVVTTDTAGDYASALIAQNMNVDDNTYQQYTVYLDSNVVNSSSERPGFLFYSVNGSYNYIYLDSVEVEELPACVAYNFAESNVTDSSADLSWSFTGNNSFNVEYGPTGFIQGTGTGAQAGTTVSSVSAPYSLTGLNPNTTYDYYVESACNPGTWYGPFTFTTECTGPLAAGTYTVGATGDFATLDSVMSTLNVCGIGGAVTFEFQAGSFIASQPIGEINGSSATNTITFKGGSAADTITAGGDAAFVLEGAKHMVFEDLYIYAPGSKGFRLNGTEDVTIDGNTIEIGATTSSLANGIVASASSTSIYSTTIGEKDLTITDNHVDGGYFAIRLYGSSAGRNENVEISGNTVMNTYYYGIYLYYGTDVTISDNQLSGFGSNFAYGIYPYQVDGAVISLNHVSDCYYGVYAYYLSSTSAATQSSEISNNMFDAGYYGLSVLYGDSVGVYHNTARGGYAGVRDYYNGTSVNFRNNIFVGGTYALYNYNTNAFGDYNLYHSTGTYLGYSYVSSPYALTYIDSLGQLQALDSTMHMSSVEGDPIFAGATDLHVFGPLANDAGDNTVGITVDIDGDTRPMSGSTVVDMGADEYDITGNDAAVTMLVSPTNGICGDDSILVEIEIANNGQDTISSLLVGGTVHGQSLSTNLTGLSIPFGGKDTVTLGYVNNYVGGSMSILAYTQLTNDGRPNNDTLITAVAISDAQQVSPIYPEYVCSGDDVVLGVSIPTQGKVLWTSGIDTLAIIDADSTLTLNGLTNDTTITVGSSPYSVNVGQSTPGSGYSYSGAYGLSFTTYSAMTLDSVTLYPSGPGTSNIVIEDATTGTQLYNYAVSTTTSGYNPEQVFLGASLGTGSYKIWLNGTTTGGLYDNLSATYPYYSSDSNVVITGDRNGGQSWYEYFYDWKVSIGGCAREDSTFTIKVSSPPSALSSYTTDSICFGGTATLSGIQTSINYWNTGDSAATIETDTSGIYVVVSSLPGCYTVTDTFDITVFEASPISITSSSGTALCIGDSSVLSLPAHNEYTWSTGDSSNAITVFGTGSYYADVTDTNGCEFNSDTISLIVNPLPSDSITVTGNLVFCEGDSVTFEGLPGLSYDWNTGDSSQSIVVNTTSLIYSTVSNQFGCSVISDTLSTTALSLPNDSLTYSGPQEFCEGESVTISGDATNSYLWNDGDSSVIRTISTEGTYSLSVTAPNGCSVAIDSIIITVNDLPNDSIFASGATTFCLGDSVTIHSADLNANHLWSNLDTSESILVTSAGSYYVGLVSDKGCIAASDTIGVVVNPNPNPNVTVTGSLDLCPGDSVTLSGNSGFTYAWSTGDSTQSITLGQTASVSLDVTNAFGCTSTSTVQDVILHAFPTTSQILGDTTGIVPLQQYQYVVSQTPGNTYQWSAVNGAIVSGQGTNIASVMWSQDTIGSLSVVESNGYCTDTAHLAIRTHIGLEELLADQLMIYPNPSQGQVTLESTLSLSRISLYTTTGELINVIETDESTFTFDLSEYPSGVYWISVYGRQYKVVIID